MKYFRKEDLEKLKKIYDEVKILDYNDNNFLDLINYMVKAITIAKKLYPKESNNPCLHYLSLTNEKEIELMKQKGILEEERITLFKEAKTNLMLDLLHNCFDLAD